MSPQSANLCTCTGNTNNLGLPGCLTELGAPRRFWFGEVFKEDGTRNAFDPTAALDLTYMNTFLKNESTVDRVLPSIKADDFIPEKADPETEVAASGRIGITKEGVITHEAVFWTDDPYTYKALFDGRKCKEQCVWIEDTEGNLIGEATIDGELGGRRIEGGSMVATVTDRTFTTKAKLTVKWSYKLVSGDEKVSYIKAADFASDFTLESAEGLLDAELEFVGSPTQTGGTFKMFLFYGSLGQKIPVPSFTPAELDGFNEDTPAAVTLLTCTDAATEGTYLYTHASQTLGNEFHIEGIGGVTIQNDIDTKRIGTVSGTLIA